LEPRLHRGGELEPIVRYVRFVSSTIDSGRAVSWLLKRESVSKPVI
jgi:hypothetical protein